MKYDLIKDDICYRRCNIAGFGNKPTDVEAYREIGLSPSRIFIINKVIP